MKAELKQKVKETLAEAEYLIQVGKYKKAKELIKNLREELEQ